MKSLNLSAIEQEQIIKRNGNSRPAYKKDWQNHRFNAAITWKPGDYKNFPTMKNTIEGHYLQTSMAYIFMNDFIDKYTVHGPGIFLHDSVHLHDRDGYDIIDDAISLHGCLLGLIKKINKYQILVRYEHSPFQNYKNKVNTQVSEMGYWHGGHLLNIMIRWVTRRFTLPVLVTPSIRLTSIILKVLLDGYKRRNRHMQRWRRLQIHQCLIASRLPQFYISRATMGQNGGETKLKTSHLLMHATL